MPMSSPRVVLRRSLRAARHLPHARLGRGDVAAQRGSHRREDVHGRPVQGVRRSRAGHPPADRRAEVGPARRRHRVDRPRAAHDVAASSTRRTRCTTRRSPRKFGDSIERVYRRADEFVGEVLAAHRAGHATMIVLSDHGFHSFGKAVNLNTWLVQQGYMAPPGADSPARRSSTTCSAAAASSGKTSTGPARGLRDGPRPDLLQPARAARARASSARAPSTGSSPTSCRRRLLTMTDPKTGRADRPRGLQARRRVFGAVPDERVRAAGRHRGRLPRVVADHARRLAAGDRLPEHEEVERRPRRVRLPGRPRAC